MNILPIDRAENNLLDAEILRRDAIATLWANLRRDLAGLQAADALVSQRRAEFDAAFVAALCVGPGEVAA